MTAVARRAVRLLLALALIPIAVVGHAQEAPAAGTDDFVFLYFPHDSTDVVFSNDWGAGRSGGRRHRGTDVFSEKLTPVVAVADGFVERIRKGRRAGWYVKLRHADDWTTYYMHLNNDTPGTDDQRNDRNLAIVEGLEVGDFVAAGEVIAYVGDSGNAEGTRPHTHFELHRRGRAVNPFPYLDAAWQRQLRINERVGELL
jgi:murein DD-endopeptidase MepM/ murein hydrolase activator NlpD